MLRILPTSYERILLLLVTTVFVWLGANALVSGPVTGDGASTKHRQHVVAKPEQTAVQPASKPDYSLTTESTAGASIPVITHIPTTQKVVFLTIDDGLTRTPEATRLLRDYNIRAPIFLNDEYVRESPAYFKQLLQQGMVLGDHTVDHPDLTRLSYNQQVSEICDNATTLEQLLGSRPTLFRPPFGSYNANTLLAAKQCGMRAVVMWSAKANGGSMQYQDGHNGLQPGDIVLMHFRPEFVQDFRAFMDAATEAGLQPANLDEWLQP